MALSFQEISVTLHNLAASDALRDLLCESHVFPWRIHSRVAMNQIKRVIFPPKLRAEHYTRHLLRADGALMLVSQQHMSYCLSPFMGERFGAFCSIARGGKRMGDKHPYERVSTHPIGYGPYYRQVAGELGVVEYRPWSPYEESVSKPFSVGSDVWLGEDVLIAGGVHIGNGAIVAARAVVTKDVPPYAIVGGVPARIIKYRFPEDLRQRLLATEWWEYSLKDLAAFSFDDPEAFCDAFEARRGEFKRREKVFVTAQDLLALA